MSKEKNNGISKEILKIFDHYDSEIEKIEHSGLLKPKKDSQRVFSYKDRYQLKDNDPSKCNFAPNAQLSKKYEKILKQKAHFIIPNIEIYFE